LNLIRAEAELNVEHFEAADVSTRFGLRDLRTASGNFLFLSTFLSRLPLLNDFLVPLPIRVLFFQTAARMNGFSSRRTLVQNCGDSAGDGDAAFDLGNIVVSEGCEAISEDEGIPQVTFSLLNRRFLPHTNPRDVIPQRSSITKAFRPKGGFAWHQS
jgi:hypothetical protein